MGAPADGPGLPGPRPPEGPTGGLLVVDKPAGWTSHDVVGRVRRVLGTRRVGHAGTLDPMATGVLVLGVGRATRLLTYLVGSDKEYLATIRLGQGTLTDDAEGETTSAVGAQGVLEEVLAAAAARLTGTIDQVPSAVSAVKVDGRRSYARVRAGEDVALAPRRVTVHRFEITAVRHDAATDGTAVTDLDVAVACSSGTYVRALARDLGASLGVGGHLTALRRTRVGPFTLADAVGLGELDGDVRLIDLTSAARRCFPLRALDESETDAVRHGRAIRVDPGAADVPDGRPVAALAPHGGVVALLAAAGERARPVLVLDPA